MRLHNSTRRSTSSTSRPRCRCNRTGTFSCRQPFVDGDLLVCGVNGVWQISSHCCGPYTCYDPPGDEQPHCECGPKALDSNLVRDIAGNDDVAVEAPRSVSSERSADPVAHGCSPGTFECRKKGTEIFLCNTKGFWELSQVCKGASKCNVRSNGEAYCGPGRLDHKVSPGSAISSARSADIQQACQPGELNCSIMPATNQGVIMVCNASGQWQVSAYCGAGVHCRAGEHGEVYCDPRS
ncbi:hypothetical protein HBI55_220310 [Parastagonospora nodorum]|nr:hypothetical protein HBI55_220310 [Parastagonospora nodorum]